jgi:hypothetical protein
MNNVTNLKHKDGDDFTTETEFATIEIADNGYVIHLTTDESEYKYVFSYDNRKEMMKFLGGVLGV